MVTHHRTLTGGEREGLCPAQTNAYTKLTDLRVLVNAAWIASYIQARNTHSTSDLRDTHHGVEHCSWRLSCTCTVTTCLKTYTVDCRIYNRLTEDLFDHIRQFGISPEINSFAAETACLLKPFRVHITYDDYGGAEQLSRCSACQFHRSSTGSWAGFSSALARLFILPGELGGKDFQGQASTLLRGYRS